MRREIVKINDRHHTEHHREFTKDSKLIKEIHHHGSRGGGGGGGDGKTEGRHFCPPSLKSITHIDSSSDEDEGDNNDGYGLVKGPAEHQMRVKTIVQLHSPPPKGGERFICAVYGGCIETPVLLTPPHFAPH